MNTDTIPPLPLVDQCLFIDNSLIELLTTCPRAFEYSAMRKRVIKGSKSSLIFGSAIHLALEWRYRNCKNNAPTAEDESAMMNVIVKHFEENPIPEDDRRSVNSARELIKHYNIKYRLEPFSVLLNKDGNTMVEQSFVFPIGKYDTTHAVILPWDGVSPLLPHEIGLFFCGRIDLPVSWSEQIIIVDHKTDGMFFGPDNFLMEQKMSNQHLGYCYGFERLTGQSVGGYCVNGLGTKEPPGYVTGAVKKTTNQKSPEEWWSWIMPRDVNYLALTPGWQEQWLESTMSSIEYLLWMWRRGVLPATGMFTRACAKYGGCQFRDVCQLGKEKRVDMLESEVYQDNTWSPLKDVVKKKKE